MLVFVAAIGLLAAGSGPDRPVQKAPPPGAPTPQQAHYPAKAKGLGVRGEVVLDCLITADGHAHGCSMVSEAPASLGFGPAALELSPELMFSPARQAGKPIAERSQFTVYFPPDEPPHKTDPAWFKKPSAEQIIGAWPADALRKGLGGMANLDCRVDLHGLADDCVVVSESPTGVGFGSAALALVPQLLFKPATDERGPVASRVAIPINFKTSGPVPAGGASLVLSYSLIRNAAWAAAPGFEELGRAYPKDGGGRLGYVALQCDLKGAGDVGKCAVTREEPRGFGFAAAAQKLTKTFRADLTGLERKPGQELKANLVIRLLDPQGEEFRSRRLGEPIWLTRATPEAAAALFPKAAREKGLTTGRGLVRCHVSREGAVGDCSSLSGEPDGLGFSEAAQKLASSMRMARWTQAGGPVDGVIDLPIRFNLSSGPSPATVRPEAAAPKSSQ